jgi:two-component system, sensor histidine kinase and response regulator
VFADAKMLGTVLRNLVSNAIKFSNPGGHIRIKSHNSGNNVRILIEDEGIGISPENLKILFSLSPGDIKKGIGGENGTGLGLIICKRFIEKNNGSIFVKSEKGQGTSIEIFLPSNC